jgi:hypothetical protein
MDRLRRRIAIKAKGVKRVESWLILFARAFSLRIGVPLSRIGDEDPLSAERMNRRR